MDHSSLDIPAALMDRSHPSRNPYSIDDLGSNIESIDYFGNKTPTYFYRLEGILNELDGCPAIACVRNPRSVALSYSTRAMAKNDRWAEGRRGIFAAGDALMLAHALSNLKDTTNVLIVPQKSLLEDWRGVVDSTIKVIAEDWKLEFDDEKLQEIEKIKNRQSRRKKLELEDFEIQAITRLEDAGLSQFFEGTEPFFLNDRRQELSRIIHDLPPDPVDYIQNLCIQHHESAPKEYFKRWQNPAKKAWRTFELSRC